MNDDHIGVKVNGVLYVRLEDARRLREGWDKADEHIKAQAAEITRLRADLAAARREGMEEAARALIEKYQSMVIRPNTPEAWRLSILQDLRAMAGEKPNVITAADIDAAAIRAAAGEDK